jgi:arginine repressor
LLLSNYLPNSKTPEFIKNHLIKYNIGVTQTTLIKKLSNCEASKVKNGKCGNCEKCYNVKDITFKIHGKSNKNRILNQ